MSYILACLAHTIIENALIKKTCVCESINNRHSFIGTSTNVVTVVLVERNMTATLVQKECLPLNTILARQKAGCRSLLHAPRAPCCGKTSTLATGCVGIKVLI